MSFKDVALNIVTFGAHQRIKNEEERYESMLEELRELHEKHEARRQEINIILEEVIAIKKDVILHLKKAQNLINQLSIKQRDILDKQIENSSYSLDMIDTSIGAGEMAINASKGAVAGVSTALGAWALAGAIGTASTGTAISTLSGIAATNATLAWLGGGSLAAGGLGMAGGTVVLGGLVAIPILAVTGLFQHLSANKKIKALRGEEIKIAEYINKIQGNLTAFNAIENRSKELIVSLQKSMDAFVYEYKAAKKHIFPFGIFSRLYKQVRKSVFKRPYYSDKDLLHIQNLGATTGMILKMVDSPVF